MAKKKISNNEIVKSLDTSMMTIDELINLRIKIIDEMQKRCSGEIDLPQNYKSFQIIDFSYTVNNNVLSLIIDEYGNLMGVNQKLNFYIGKVDDELNITLLEFTRKKTNQVTAFQGKLSENHIFFGNSYWSISQEKIINCYNEILSREKNSLVYDRIYDRKIDGIETLIKTSYLNTVMINESLLSIIDKLKQKEEKPKGIVKKKINSN